VTATPVVVIGQIARDLAVRVDRIPDAGGTVDIEQRRELLGGKGANIAVGLAQLGIPVCLLGVVGDDPVGAQLVEQCARDDIDTDPVVRRAGADSALMIDLVTADGRWRYLESVPEGTLLTKTDVEAQAERLARTDTLVIQLQQPVEAALTAIELAGSSCRVILDGSPPGGGQDRDRLLRAATVLRCDGREAELIAGRPVRDAVAGRAVARELLDTGPALVVLAIGDDGNLGVWSEGEVLVPLADTEVVDSTGGGDAFVAALTWALSHDDDPARAIRLATAAAGMTVGHLAGRPALNPDQICALADNAGRRMGSGR
jgi:ribokinase